VNHEGLGSLDIKQILSDEKRQEVIALGRLGSRYGALRGNLKAWVSRIGEGVANLVSSADFVDVKAGDSVSSSERLGPTAVAVSLNANSTCKPRGFLAISLNPAETIAWRVVNSSPPRCPRSS
jgi:hypothetical protein